MRADVRRSRGDDCLGYCYNTGYDWTSALLPRGWLWQRSTWQRKAISLGLEYLVLSKAPAYSSSTRSVRVSGADSADTFVSGMDSHCTHDKRVERVGEVRVCVTDLALDGGMVAVLPPKQAPSHRGR